jgi:cobyric acid synthase
VKNLMVEIGLVYVKGSLPRFEEFGNIPTCTILEDGTANGKPASEVVDLVILPGGSMIESKSITARLQNEIISISRTGFVLGICSGFQILSNWTNTGRKSPVPLITKGMGLLDAEFDPLICTDQVHAEVVGESFLTNGMSGKNITGFHCHTYGKISIGKNAIPILISHAKRLNYTANETDILSGVSNKKGNVVGIMPHAILDENPGIIDNILQSLDVSRSEGLKIKKKNRKLVKKMQQELGICSHHATVPQLSTTNTPQILVLTATRTGAGKTFITAGIAGALAKRGHKVCVMKVGSDLRDVIPALYLVKEPVKKYTTIQIGDRGWMPVHDAIQHAIQDKYGYILIEGTMGALSGLLDPSVEYPMSTIKTTMAINAPVLLITDSKPHGLESAVIDLKIHIETLQGLGVTIRGVLINKYPSIPSIAVKKAVADFLNPIKVLGIIPKVAEKKRGILPEIEIQYEIFTQYALDSVEEYVELDEMF